MSKLTQEEIVQKMNELTPEYFAVPGGKFAGYTVTLDDGTIYSQAVARILHANEEHAAKEGQLTIVIKNIDYVTQLINGNQVPIAVITVQANSSLYGIRENIMTAVLDSSSNSDKIASTHPIEKAVTQAIGRTLALYGFGFTGVLASEEEIYEGKDRQQRLENKNKTVEDSPITLLKTSVKNAGKEWSDFLNDNNVTEEELINQRPLLFKLMGQLTRNSS